MPFTKRIVLAIITLLVVVTTVAYLSAFKNRRIKSAEWLMHLPALPDVFSESVKIDTVKLLTVINELNPTGRIIPDEDSVARLRLDQVWVAVTVDEPNFSNVKQGSKATVTAFLHPNRQFYGTIKNIGDMPDAPTQTIKLQIALNNHDYLLRPGMFITITLHSAGTEQRPAIPAQSVVFEQGRNLVVMCEGEDRLQIREVKIYKTLNGITYLTGGIQPGKRILARPQQFVHKALNNE